MSKGLKSSAYLFDGGAVITPKTLATVPVLPDGQIAAVTDQPGVNLMVRKGGVLVPAVDARAISSLSDINMAVDYATGTSPPYGTMVRNQAEYDALGITLKYPQDALDILPPILNHRAVVALAAGNHYAKDASSGRGDGAVIDTFHMPITYGPSDHYPALILSPTPAGITHGVRFVGSTTTIEAGIAGTWTTGIPGSNLFTRSSGTWVPDELKGKRLSITSGAGAGSIRVIISNTTNTLMVASNVTAGGAAVISTFSLASILVPRLSPGGTLVKTLFFDYSTGYYGATRALLQFVYVQFDAAADHALYGSVFAGSTWAYYCDFYSFITIFSNTAAFVYCLFSPIISETDMVNIRGDATNVSLSNCYFMGPGAGNHVWILENPLIVFGNNYLEARPGFSGYLIRSLDRGEIWFARAVLAGNGSCTGILASGNCAHDWESLNMVTINNCAVALQASYVDLNVSGLAGSGNAKVFSLSNGSTIRTTKSGTTITGTTYATIDGEDFAASDFAAAGDGIEGRYGSVLDMT